ncbi:hypothetical protein HDU97_000912 [Phlyctochytrium planicorne]|nr:hypothetical protein HDU97_000912 [Phlyctochytrium planicorne]
MSSSSLESEEFLVYRDESEDNALNAGANVSQTRRSDDDLHQDYSSYEELSPLHMASFSTLSELSLLSQSTSRGSAPFIGSQKLASNLERENSLPPSLPSDTNLSINETSSLPSNSSTTPPSKDNLASSSNLDVRLNSKLPPAGLDLHGSLTMSRRGSGRFNGNINSAISHVEQESQLKIIFPLHVQREALTGKVKDLAFPVISFSDETASKTINSLIPRRDMPEQSSSVDELQEDRQPGKKLPPPNRKGLASRDSQSRARRDNTAKLKNEDVSILDMTVMMQASQKSESKDITVRKATGKSVVWTHDYLSEKIGVETPRQHEVVAPEEGYIDTQTTTASRRMTPSVSRKASGRQKSAKSASKRCALKLRVSSAFKRIPSAAASNRPKTSFSTACLPQSTSIGIEAHMRRAAVSGRLSKTEPVLSIVKVDRNASGFNNLSYMLADKGAGGFNAMKSASARLTVEGERVSKTSKGSGIPLDKKTLLAMRMRKSDGVCLLKTQLDQDLGRKRETYEKADLDDLIDWEDNSSSISNHSGRENTSAADNSAEVVAIGEARSLQVKEKVEATANDEIVVVQKSLQQGGKIAAVNAAHKDSRSLLPVLKLNNYSEGEFSSDNMTLNVVYLSDDEQAPGHLLEHKHKERWLLPPAEDSRKQKPPIYGDSILHIEGNEKVILSSNAEKENKVNSKADLPANPLSFSILDLEKEGRPDCNGGSLDHHQMLLARQRMKPPLTPQSVSITNIQLPNIHPKPKAHVPRIRPFTTPDEDTITFSALRDNFLPGRPLIKTYTLSQSKLSIVQPRHHPKLFMTLRPISGVKRELVTFANNDLIKIDPLLKDPKLEVDGDALSVAVPDERPPTPAVTLFEPMDTNPMIGNGRPEEKQSIDASSNMAQINDSSVKSATIAATDTFSGIMSPAFDIGHSVLSPTPWK